jgi:hypothetical protein
MIRTLDTAAPVNANPLPGILRALQAALLGRPASRSRESHPVHELASGSTMVLCEPFGRRVECLDGCVWITLDGDPRDIVVEAGQTFTADRNQRALIHALEASLVRVNRPAP